ncbi:hypothetical protein QR680_007329 [Steinernema hermaphroditum]|uniref:Uncharacterized protein n=1 Tax=Steinernema hermaphroditum TaxID=289476 RepID=A0AA39M602_9BILA|nr:hypothetical protein QR680_007329 [Steinernema hermaphroditum]
MQKSILKEKKRKDNGKMSREGPSRRIRQPSLSKEGNETIEDVDKNGNETVEEDDGKRKKRMSREVVPRRSKQSASKDGSEYTDDLNMKTMEEETDKKRKRCKANTPTRISNRTNEGNETVDESESVSPSKNRINVIRRRLASIRKKTNKAAKSKECDTTEEQTMEEKESVDLNKAYAKMIEDEQKALSQLFYYGQIL